MAIPLLYLFVGIFAPGEDIIACINAATAHSSADSNFANDAMLLLLLLPYMFL